MKNKGFTLIELLAVIVILAIIALIATPIILGIINDARTNAKKRSAELVYTGVEYAYTSVLFKQTSNGTVKDDASLAEINAELNVDNVESHSVSGTDADDSKNTMQILTKDNVYCAVKHPTANKYTVTCGTENDYTGSDVLATKTLSYETK